MNEPSTSLLIVQHTEIERQKVYCNHSPVFFFSINNSCHCFSNPNNAQHKLLVHKNLHYPLVASIHSYRPKHNNKASQTTYCSSGNTFLGGQTLILHEVQLSRVIEVNGKIEYILGLIFHLDNQSKHSVIGQLVVVVHLPFKRLACITAPNDVIFQRCACYRKRWIVF